MASSSRTASLSLRFTIVGGGIAGLASAYTLQKAGHQVLVLEKASGPTKGGGGMRSPPNMNRILDRWGLGPQLAQYAIKGSEISFRLVETGEKVGVMIFHDEIMQGFGADWLYLQHGDLQSWLHTLATQAGATIRYNSSVVSVDPTRASVTLSTGEVIWSDLIIGADGLQSLVRRSVVGRGARTSDDESQLHVFNSSIPAHLIRAHENLRDLLSHEMHMWMGNGYAIYGHATHGFENYSFTITAPLRQHSRHYDRDCRLPQFDIDRDTLEPRVQTLMDLVTTGVIAPPVSREPLESLVHDSGKVILIGSAAHLVPPGQTQNVAIGIEDAATLGNLFSRLRARQQIPSLVSAYEEIRQPRSAEVLASELGKLAQVTLPAKSELETIRNHALQSALSQAVLDWEQADEELLREQWDEYIRIFDYDADEVAEDWWIKWGKLMDAEHQNQRERSLQSGLSGAQMHISVSRVPDRRMGMRA